MLIDLILYVFTSTGRFWNVGGKATTPTEEDVRKTLDEAARLLYSEEVGTSLTVGGLHIIKHETGYDTYVYTGNYT